MEEKPVTDLVLLPPLDLIPVESLPQRCGQELALLKQQRSGMFVEISKNSVATILSGLGAALYGWLSFLTWLGFGPWAGVFFVILSVGCVGLSTLFAIMLRLSVRDMRALRQKIVPPQLQIGAENETILSEMAHLTNTQIISWNKRAECAPVGNIDKRFLQGLKKERLLLSTNIEKVKSVAKSIEQDGFESEAKDEPETE